MLLTPVPVTLNTPVVVKLPAATFAVTVNELSVPTDVIFGWLAVVTVPAVVAAPLSVAVTMFALKLPSASRITTVFAVAAVGHSHARRGHLFGHIRSAAIAAGHRLAACRLCPGRRVAGIVAERSRSALSPPLGSARFSRGAGRIAGPGGMG